MSNHSVSRPANHQSKFKPSRKRKFSANKIESSLFPEKCDDLPNKSNDDVEAKLKSRSPEQSMVVGPLVRFLISIGWDIEQIMFGRKEWRVPKSPSEAHKREKGQSFDGFPCDITVFDSVKRTSDAAHVVAIIECKQPDEESGVSQLEQLMSNEPRVKFGAWCNSADPSAQAVFIYREKSGHFLRKRKLVRDLPHPGEKISPKYVRVEFRDLALPSEESLRKIISHLLDRVVINDSNVTRREEQLDQLCNLFLLKLESDKRAKAEKQTPFFRQLATPARTGEEIRKHFAKFVDIYPEVFTEERDRQIHFTDETIHFIAEELGDYRLIDLGIQTVSLAFQVLRSAALKQEEGQYFTPQPVIEAGIRLLKLQWDDLIIDPACGTGGFLLQAMVEMGRRWSDKAELSRWAQTHIYGIDKDKIGVKLTKAVMQIAGDGSAQCVRGDSIRTHQWEKHFPHMISRFDNGRFSVVVTNPPFGNNLKVSAEDARLAGLDIAKAGGTAYQDMEIGLLFLHRAYDLLKVGGRLGIVLPETYFFSTNYSFIFDWIRSRFRPLAVANVPMEAFQGFCRAKTNFYVFEKIKRQCADKVEVVLLNPATCGINKAGDVRYKIDAGTGKRTREVDNELAELTEAYLDGKNTPAVVSVPLAEVLAKRVLVPRYYDQRWDAQFQSFCKANALESVSIGELLDTKILRVRGGHGSPSNDRRGGTIPYIKVSDIRSLRMNVNPTNLVTKAVAESFWGCKSSGVKPWSVITPNRASSNIGEFAMILPGEENVVITKEVLIFTVETGETDGWDAFYLFWALCLRCVRQQWQRITLMQTNREDCGARWREVLLPKPKSAEWAREVSAAFRDYFTTIGTAKTRFVNAAKASGFEYIASVTSTEVIPVAVSDQNKIEAD
jgi:type I restriction enzyme M protein